MGGGVGGEVPRVTIGAEVPRGRMRAAGSDSGSRAPGASATTRIALQCAAVRQGSVPQSEQGSDCRHSAPAVEAGSVSCRASCSIPAQWGLVTAAGNGLKGVVRDPTRKKPSQTNRLRTLTTISSPTPGSDRN